MKRLLGFLLAALMIFSVVPAGVFAEEESDIHIFFNDTEIVFNKPTVLKNDKIMCEIKPLFAALNMTYDYNPLTKELRGSLDDDMFTVTVGGDIIELNNVKVELDEKFYIAGREIMLPLDMLCYIYNIQIDRSDLSNVKLWFKEEEGYDLQAEIEKFNKLAEPYRTEIIKGGMEYFETAERQLPEYSREDYIDVEGQSFDKAYDWEATSLPATYYSAQLAAWQKTPVKKGDVFVVSFWAKGIFARSDGGKIQLDCVVEKNLVWEKPVHEVLQLTTDWVEYRLIGKAFSDMDDWSINFRQHFSLQQIQLADVRVDVYSNLPEDLQVPQEPLTYQGMEEDALWRKEALKRIEKYRKNNMVINVTDTEGNPVEGATVNAKMTRSEVDWGSMIWGNNLETGHLQETTSGYWGERWLERLKELGVNTLVGNVKAPDTTDVKAYAELVNWCINNDIDVRAHCLYWETGTGIENRGEWMLQEVKNANWNIDSVSVDEIRARMEKQINMVATYVGDTAVQIDVMNEVATRFTDGITSAGWDEGIRMYEMVDQICPDAKLVHLETVAGNTRPDVNSLPDHIAYTKYLIDMGAPIDVGGIQGHHSTPEHPQNWYDCIDAFAQVVPEVAITEYDSAIEYELRDEYLRDTLIACYSHPALTSFIVWVYDFDGKDPDLSVFWDRDEERHPAYYEWDKLINHEWKTNETTTTDANGSTTIRGHRGRYDIAVTVNGKSQTLAMTLGKDDTQNIVNVVVGDEITMTSPNLYVPKEKHAYVDWKDYGKLTEINMPVVNRKWEPCTIIEDCRDAEGTLVPHVFDGRNDSFWSAGGKDDYLTVKLGETVPLKSFIVHWHSGSVKRYNHTIEVSEDGENWTKVYSGKNSAMDETIDLNGYSAQYIRISGTDGKLAVDDVQVYTK